MNEEIYINNNSILKSLDEAFESAFPWFDPKMVSSLVLDIFLVKQQCKKNLLAILANQESFEVSAAHRKRSDEEEKEDEDGLEQKLSSDKKSNIIKELKRFRDFFMEKSQQLSISNSPYSFFYAYFLFFIYSKKNDLHKNLILNAHERLLKARELSKTFEKLNSSDIDIKAPRKVSSSPSISRGLSLQEFSFVEEFTKLDLQECSLDDPSFKPKATDFVRNKEKNQGIPSITSARWLFLFIRRFQSLLPEEKDALIEWQNKFFENSESVFIQIDDDFNHIKTELNLPRLLSAMKQAVEDFRLFIVKHLKENKIRVINNFENLTAGELVDEITMFDSESKARRGGIDERSSSSAQNQKSEQFKAIKKYAEELLIAQDFIYELNCAINGEDFYKVPFILNRLFESLFETFLDDALPEQKSIKRKEYLGFPDLVIYHYYARIRLSIVAPWESFKDFVFENSKLEPEPDNLKLLRLRAYIRFYQLVNSVGEKAFQPAVHNNTEQGLKRLFVAIREAVPEYRSFVKKTLLKKQFKLPQKSDSLSAEGFIEVARFLLKENKPQLDSKQIEEIKNRINQFKKITLFFQELNKSLTPPYKNLPSVAQTLREWFILDGNEVNKSSFNCLVIIKFYKDSNQFPDSLEKLFFSEIFKKDEKIESIYNLFYRDIIGYLDPYIHFQKIPDSVYNVEDVYHNTIKLMSIQEIFAKIKTALSKVNKIAFTTLRNAYKDFADKSLMIKDQKLVIQEERFYLIDWNQIFKKISSINSIFLEVVLKIQDESFTENITVKNLILRCSLYNHIAFSNQNPTIQSFQNWLKSLQFPLKRTRSKRPITRDSLSALLIKEFFEEKVYVKEIKTYEPLNNLFINGDDEKVQHLRWKYWEQFCKMIFSRRQEDFNDDGTPKAISYLTPAEIIAQIKPAYANYNTNYIQGYNSVPEHKTKFKDFLGSILQLARAEQDFNEINLDFKKLDSDEILGSGKLLFAFFRDARVGQVNKNLLWYLLVEEKNRDKLETNQRFYWDCLKNYLRDSSNQAQNKFISADLRYTYPVSINRALFSYVRRFGVPVLPQESLECFLPRAVSASMPLTLFFCEAQEKESIIQYVFIKGNENNISQQKIDALRQKNKQDPSNAVLPVSNQNPAKFQSALKAFANARSQLEGKSNEDFHSHTVALYFEAHKKINISETLSNFFYECFVATFARDSVWGEDKQDIIKNKTSVWNAINEDVGLVWPAIRHLLGMVDIKEDHSNPGVMVELFRHYLPTYLLKEGILQAILTCIQRNEDFLNSDLSRIKNFFQELIGLLNLIHENSPERQAIFKSFLESKRRNFSSPFAPQKPFSFPELYRFNQTKLISQKDIQDLDQLLFYQQNTDVPLPFPFLKIGDLVKKEGSSAASKSAHAVHVYTLKRGEIIRKEVQTFIAKELAHLGEGKEILVFVKMIDSKHEVEQQIKELFADCFLGNFYRWIIGRNACLSVPLMDDSGRNIIGKASIGMVGFTSFKKMLPNWNQHKNPFSKFYGISSLNAVCFLGEENDGHTDNAGIHNTFSDKICIAKIDHDYFAKHIEKKSEASAFDIGLFSEANPCDLLGFNKTLSQRMRFSLFIPTSETNMGSYVGQQLREKVDGIKDAKNGYTHTFISDEDVPKIEEILKNNEAFIYAERFLFYKRINLFFRNNLGTKFGPRGDKKQFYDNISGQESSSFMRDAQNLMHIFKQASNFSSYKANIEDWAFGYYNRLYSRVEECCTKWEKGLNHWTPLVAQYSSYFDETLPHIIPVNAFPRLSLSAPQAVVAGEDEKVQLLRQSVSLLRRAQVKEDATVSKINSIIETYNEIQSQQRQQMVEQSLSSAEGLVSLAEPQALDDRSQFEYGLRNKGLQLGYASGFENNCLIESILQLLYPALRRVQEAKKKHDETKLWERDEKIGLENGRRVNLLQMTQAIRNLLIVHAKGNLIKLYSEKGTYKTELDSFPSQQASLISDLLRRLNEIKDLNSPVHLFEALRAKNNQLDSALKRLDNPEQKIKRQERLLPERDRVYPQLESSDISLIMNCCRELGYTELRDCRFIIHRAQLQEGGQELIEEEISVGEPGLMSSPFRLFAFPNHWVPVFAVLQISQIQRRASFSHSLSSQKLNMQNRGRSASISGPRRLSREDTYLEDLKNILLTIKNDRYFFPGFQFKYQFWWKISLHQAVLESDIKTLADELQLHQRFDKLYLLIEAFLQRQRQFQHFKTHSSPLREQFLQAAYDWRDALLLKELKKLSQSDFKVTDISHYRVVFFALFQAVGEIQLQLDKKTISFSSLLESAQKQQGKSAYELKFTYPYLEAFQKAVKDWLATNSKSPFITDLKQSINKVHPQTPSHITLDWLNIAGNTSEHFHKALKDLLGIK